MAIKKKKPVKPKVSKLEKSKANHNSRFWRNKAYKLWVESARLLSGNCQFGKCAVCGEESKPCDTHHILPREIKKWWLTPENAIVLCKSHHKYSRDLSAHKNGFAFHEWLRINKPEQYAWCCSKLNDQSRELNCTMKEAHDILEKFISDRQK